MLPDSAWSANHQKAGWDFGTSHVRACIPPHRRRGKSTESGYHLTANDLPQNAKTIESGYHLTFRDHKHFHWPSESLESVHALSLRTRETTSSAWSYLAAIETPFIRLELLPSSLLMNHKWSFLVAISKETSASRAIESTHVHRFVTRHSSESINVQSLLRLENDRSTTIARTCSTDHSSCLSSSNMSNKPTLQSNFQIFKNMEK